MSVVFSCLSLFVLLIALLDNIVQATYFFRPPNSTCVWTERQLRKVIENASDKTRTRITLCRQTISISNIKNPDNSTGIELTDRVVDIRCYLKRSKGTCTLDGRGSSRIFAGERADLTVRNVRFTNAKPDDCQHGGAISGFDFNLTMAGCSFMNNGDECVVRGGAIYLSNSTLNINSGSKKMPIIFSDNESKLGGALYVKESEVNIDGNTVFSKNFAEFGGAVILDESTFNIKNVKFLENFGNFTSVLEASESQLTMKNVEFMGNDGGRRVIDLFSSSLQATNCTFANHKIMVIRAYLSKITLKNSTFSNNMSKEDGSDIYIDDDDDPSSGGTFVKCESNVVFCNGLGRTSIYDGDSSKFRNTDCSTNGLPGTPGQGSCPI